MPRSQALVALKWAWLVSEMAPEVIQKGSPSSMRREWRQRQYLPFTQRIGVEMPNDCDCSGALTQTALSQCEHDIYRDGPDSGPDKKGLYRFPSECLRERGLAKG